MPTICVSNIYCRTETRGYNNVMDNRGPGGRAEDSRSRGPEFESRHWDNF